MLSVACLSLSLSLVRFLFLSRCLLPLDKKLLSLKGAFGKLAINAIAFYRLSLSLDVK